MAESDELLIKHPFCEHPQCAIRKLQEAILCDEHIAPDGTKIITTQREKDLAKIIKFFFHKCKTDILDKEKSYMLPVDTSPWFLADPVYYFDRVNTRAWSYYIHSFSQIYEGEEIVVELKKLALYYKVKDSYIKFLKDNNLHYFIPTDLESVD